ncbi:MAG: protein serine/threonine phosphatase [Bacteroidetes bacterium]|jgi:serine phosphatase RsbU (regulator of sigma subunit)/tetratricopeptide (TPR) repeat protein|nr:protein serine/threonine phosphatase [Bacteroidota bacterium]
MGKNATALQLFNFQFIIGLNRYCRLAFFLVLFCAFFCVPLDVSAQQSKIEELEEKLEQTSDDKSRIDILNSLGEQYLRTQPAKARKICLTALDIANRTGNSKGKINSCNTIGNSYYLEGDFNSSLEYYLKALKINEEIGDKKGIANGLMGIGNIYSAQGNNKLSLEYLLKSLKIMEEINYKDGIAGCLNNIGIIYMDYKEYEKALDYQLRSLKMKQEIGDKKGTSSNLGNIGAIYYQQENYTLALEYQQKAFEIRKELNNKKGMAMSYIDIGNIYEKQGKYPEAVESQLNAVKIAKEVGYKVALKSAYLGLSSVYEKLNKPGDALENYKLFTAIKDSIFNTENSAKLIEMQTKFDTDRKEKEIALLTKGKEISGLLSRQQQLELVKQKMEAAQKTKEIELKETELRGEKLKSEAQSKELKIQEAEVEKERMMRNSVAGGLLLVSALAVLLVLGIKQKQRANKTLEQKNKEIAEAYQIIEINRDQIAEKNKNITDSINYARRIQQAILPSREEINRSLNDYFILYKPKDIVSGDFYFYAERNDRVIVAVADCTGHGVPGAFMSMIGNDILNQVIIEKGITRPAEILNLLNKGVKKALKQESTKSETGDGMDIALCSIDLKNSKVEFAGAMRPLYHASGEIFKINADKASIGGATDENFKFTEQIIKVKKGDSIYIYTDGYLDQFGGEKGKKFMAKNFKNLLSSIHHKPMKEQHDILDVTLTDWAREREQVDDILVMGIKF